MGMVVGPIEISKGPSNLRVLMVIMGHGSCAHRVFGLQISLIHQGFFSKISSARVSDV